MIVEVAMVATGDGLVGELGDREWSHANVRVARLHSELARTDDPVARSALSAQLKEARDAIAEIEARWRNDAGESPDDNEPADRAASTSAGGDESSEIDDLLAELLVDDTDAEASTATEVGAGSDPDVADPVAASLPPPEVLEEAITTDRSRIFDGVGRPRNQPRIDGVDTVGRGRSNRGPDAVPGKQPGRQDQSLNAREIVLKTAGAFVAAVIVGSAVMAWWASRGTDDGSEAPIEVPTVGADQDVAELEAVLEIFGFGDLEVVQDGTVLRISGTVANVDELRVVRETARALGDQVDVDTNGVQLAQLPSGVSESSSPSVGTERVGSTLQRDLDRLLVATPVTFAPGGRALGELDRRILNAVVALIRAAPTVNVTVIGLADDTDLAAARAEAVRAYLTGQGVDEDLLTAEPGTAPAGSDGPGVIQLVVALEGAGS